MARPVYGLGRVRSPRRPTDTMLPLVPAGHVLIGDGDGTLLVDSDGAFLYRRES